MFYVLEGIDGAGCGAQRKSLEKILPVKSLPIETLKFPYYKNEIGIVISDFLHKKHELSVEMQFLLYTSQMIMEKDKINSLRRDKVLVSDRYFPSTLAYQGLRGFDTEKGLRFAKDFQIEVPDAIFFLDTPPEVAFDRKHHEEGKVNLDRNEEDSVFLKKVDQQYRKLLATQVFAPWVVIDNTQSIDEVSEKIVKYIIQKEK